MSAPPQVHASGDWRQRLGLLRSLVIYWRPGRQRALRRLYATFVGPGDLAFDIGAHVGDRAVAFADLGARVVAAEPQPHLLPWLQRCARARPGAITVVPAALGRAAGHIELAVNRANPTISSTSAAWRQAVRTGNPGFRGQRWDRPITVPVTTLTELIAQYGLPAFCKIDVEGGEADVVAGLDQPVPALSFEFVRGALDIAVAAIDGLARLAPYEYNMIAGEGRQFAWRQWHTPGRVRDWLHHGAGGIASGDLYARLPDHRTPG